MKGAGNANASTEGSYYAQASTCGVRKPPSRASAAPRKKKQLPRASGELRLEKPQPLAQGNNEFVPRHLDLPLAITCGNGALTFH